MILSHSPSLGLAGKSLFWAKIYAGLGKLESDTLPSIQDLNAGVDPRISTGAARGGALSWFYTLCALNGEELGRGETDCFSAQSTILGIAMRLDAARAGRGGGDGNRISPT